MHKRGARNALSRFQAGRKVRLIVYGLLLSVLLGACASIGRPDGGPRDETPPSYVSSNPAPGSLNFSGNKISIHFDENVQIDDPLNKVAISPTQTQQPRITANGRRVEVELNDTLLPNTTYTLDFSDAIKDLNEGNILDGFALDFSTGADIDSLAFSGMVLQARNLEPAQGMLVGIYASDADSCITSRPFERIARTNQLGEFTVRNLKPGAYKVYALNDLNRDLHWDRSEDVAFLSEMVVPEVASDSVTRFLPNNLLLTWFNEEYQPQYLKTYKREPRNLIHLEMAAKADTLPQLTIVTLGSRGNLRMPLLEHAVRTHTVGNDTINYWLRDSTIIKADTLLIEARYRRTDSLEQLVWQTDTLKFNLRKNKTQPDGPKFLGLTLAEARQHLNKPLLFSTDRPVDSITPGAVRLEQCVDSLWLPLDVALKQISPMAFTMHHQWEPGAEYRLAVDTLGITDIYGLHTKGSFEELTTYKEEDYSAVIFSLSGLPDTTQVVVELLNGQDEPVRKQIAVGGAVKFDFLMPGTYYARLFVDTDSNGEWTNGDLLHKRQPEDVYYFPKKLVLKKNWDRNEAWDINAISVELQKPEEIKQNKPKRKTTDDTPRQDDEEDEDGFGANVFYNPNNPNNRNARF